MRSVRRWATVAAVAVALLAAVILALTFAASPASAYSDWQHDGASSCASCHSQGTPTDATCTACHPGFTSYPGETCWSCHAPGADTSTLSTPSSACSQECHLWDPVQKQYLTPTTHGTSPHLGATPECLACHPTSVSAFDPGSSPHHSGKATGFNGKCATCHASPQKHAGKVDCIGCHTSAEQFHLFQATSPGYKKCTSCHTKRHAGKKVPLSRCTQCHKGSSGRVPQHSKSVSKKFVCSGCHTKKLHASAVSRAVKSCRTCHGGKYHAAQATPSKSVCLRCHSRALRHTNGYQCTLCHRRAVHNPRPSAVN